MILPRFQFMPFDSDLVTGHTERSLASSSSPSWCFSGLSPVCPCLLYWEAKNWTCHSMYELSSAKQRRITSPDTLWQHSFMQPRILLPLFATRAHCWLIFNLVSAQDHFHQAAFHWVDPAYIAAVVPPQPRTLHFPLLNTRFLSAHGSVTLFGTSHSSQSRVISNLAEGTLCPFIQIINEGLEQDWSHYWPLGYTITFWALPRPHPTGCSHLGQFSAYLTVCMSSSYSTNSENLTGRCQKSCWSPSRQYAPSPSQGLVWGWLACSSLTFPFLQSSGTSPNHHDCLIIDTIQYHLHWCAQ